MTKRETSSIADELQFMYGGKVFFIKDEDIDTVLPALMQEIKKAKQMERGLQKSQPIKDKEGE